MLDLLEAAAGHEMDRDGLALRDVLRAETARSSSERRVVGEAAPRKADLVERPFKEAKEEWITSFERDYIAELLQRHQGNISQAAREADIDRKYFRKLMKKYEIDASIARAADVELLYDRPYEDRRKVRVAGPFTVESLSPHRSLAFAPVAEPAVVRVVMGCSRFLHPGVAPTAPVARTPRARPRRLRAVRSS